MTKNKKLSSPSKEKKARKRECQKCSYYDCHFCGRCRDNRGFHSFKFRDFGIDHYICPSCEE